MSPAATRRFPWWIYIVALLAILVFALWPVASTMIAGSIAEMNGCDLDEGSAHPCIVAGTDWGETLYAMSVMGWFMLVTVPFGAVAAGIWLIALLIHFVLWARRPA